MDTKLILVIRTLFICFDCGQQKLSGTLTEIFLLKLRLFVIHQLLIAV